MVSYYGYVDEHAGSGQATVDESGMLEAVINLTHLLQEYEVSFFYPYTTTLVELRLNREPSPPDPGQPNSLVGFWKAQD